jgi:hypothetical protein
MFRIGRNTFNDRKNKFLMKIPEFKRSGIGLIAEFRGIPNGFPNQGRRPILFGCVLCVVCCVCMLCCVDCVGLCCVDCRVGYLKLDNIIPSQHLGRNDHPRMPIT